MNRKKRLESKIEAFRPYINFLAELSTREEQAIFSQTDLQTMTTYNSLQTEYYRRYGKLYVSPEIKEEFAAYDRRKCIKHEDEVYSKK